MEGDIIMKKKYVWKPFISETATRVIKSKWFSSTIEPHRRRNANKYDIIHGVKFLVRPQTRMDDGHKVTYYPFYTFITNQPFLVKIEYHDGSEAFRIVFASTPGRAIQLVTGSVSDSILNVEVIDVVVQCEIYKDPKILTEDIGADERDKFYDAEEQEVI